MISRSRARSIVAAFVALLALAVVGFGPAPSASAWQYADNSRSEGTITLRGPLLTVAGSDAQPTIRAAGMYVTTSSFSPGDQEIWVQYLLQRLDSGAWVTVDSPPILLQRQVSAGQFWAIDGWTSSFSVGPSPGTYRVVVAVGWLDLGTDLWIASTRVEPSSAGDHVCQIAACTSSAQGVDL